jgi:hypothetical protein
MSSLPEEVIPAGIEEIPKKKSRKRENHVDGEIVFVQEEKLPPPQVVSATKMDKELRPKKPLSEKQQENLKRLIELNKTRREEKLSITAKEKLNDPKTYEVPTEIPDGMIPVVVKAKQKYNKTGNFSKIKKESQGQSIQSIQSDEDLRSKFNQLQEKFEELELKTRKSKPSSNSKRIRKVNPIYSESESESESESFTETDSDIDYSKIKKKIDKRVKKIDEIDRKISSANKYSNLSIF